MTTIIVIVAFALVLSSIVVALYGVWIYGAIFKSKNREENPNTFLCPPISVVLPAHNEEKVIYARIMNLAECTYPMEKLELVIVDDASRDDTKAIALKAMDDYGLMGKVVENKAQKGVNLSMEKGIKEAKSEIVVCTDADVYFEKNAITQVVSKLMSEKRTGAVTGDLQPLKGKEVTKKSESAYRSMYGKICEWESEVASTYCFNGALYAIKKTAPATLDIKDGAYDAGIAFSVIRNGYKAVYVSSAKVFENVPNNLSAQFKQKIRRAARLIKATWVNMDMMSGKYGRFGRVILPLRFAAFSVVPAAFFMSVCLWIYIFSSINILFLPFLVIAFLLVAISDVWQSNLVSTFILHQLYLFLGLFRALGDVDIWKQTERRGEER